MIGSLRGTVVHRSARGEVLLEVGGVGYRVTVPPSAMARLGELGATAVVHTHLNVREDSLTLYGFVTRDERDCFEALIGAHGVGPALALAILSVHPPAQLRLALSDGDLDALMLVPGVGRKTAARLLIELKSRLDLPDDDAAAQAAAAAADGTHANGNGSVSTRAEVRAALGALGYEPDEVHHALRELPADSGVEALLRSALRLLGARR
ncbi:MAG: holliday junction helicase RuvA [Actinomycetota bacterium]|nr:holliday junction helicase RuvA [Actinomycetota bacterium]